MDVATGLMVLSSLYGAYKAKQNQDEQRKAAEYQKKMNEVAMQREDNAVQRYARDMSLAGYNRLSGPGSASTGDYSGYSAPQYDTSAVQSAIQGVSDNLKWKDDYKLREEYKNLEALKVGNEIRNSTMDRIRSTMKLISDLRNNRKIGRKLDLSNEAQENLNKVIQSDTEQYLSQPGTSKQIDKSSITNVSMSEELTKMAESAGVDFGGSYNGWLVQFQASMNGQLKGEQAKRVMNTAREISFRVSKRLTTAQKDFLYENFKNGSHNNLVSDWEIEYNRNKIYTTGKSQAQYVKEKAIEYEILYGGYLF